MKNGIKLPDKNEIKANYIAHATKGDILLKIVKTNLIDQKPGHITVSFERLMRLLR